MRYNRDGYDEAWLNRLDIIASGNAEPELDDDELLQVAGQLTQALSPLQSLDEAAEERRHRLGSKLRVQLVTAPPARSRYRWRSSLNIALAVVLFLIIGPGLLMMLLPGINGPAFNLPGYDSTTRTPDGSTPIADVFQQIAYSQYSTNSNPNDPRGQLISSSLPVLYQATYLADGHYIYLSWQPANAPIGHQVVPAGVQTLQLGRTPAIVDHNSSSQYIVEWYRLGFNYQLISDLGLDQLVSFAHRLKTSNGALLVP